MSSLARKGRKAADILFYSALRFFGKVLGVKPRHRAKDRRLLDEHILTTLARNDRFARVLFVGCDWYTQHVEDLFLPRGREYTTIEIDAQRAVYGARRHIVGALADVGLHFPPGTLDLIVCNGVIGWGLNEPLEIERSIAACEKALSPDGVLLLGWDDVPEKLPIPIDEIEALRSLVPTTVEGFEGPVIRTGSYTKHTFGFFAKPPSNNATATRVL